MTTSSKVMATFHDRTPLSDIESDTEPSTRSAPAGPTPPLAVPVPDTGLKQMGAMSRETRQSKRRASQDTPAPTPADKRSRVRIDSSSDMARRMDRVEETLQDILKSVRGLAASIDSLKTTVTSKMTSMETKLSVQQDRIESLQSARRDGFLNTLTLDNSNIHPMPSVPHYVQATPPPVRCTTASTCSGPAIEDPLAAFWPNS